MTVLFFLKIFKKNRVTKQDRFGLNNENSINHDQNEKPKILKCRKKI
jgi:hypothetical protein